MNIQKVISCYPMKNIVEGGEKNLFYENGYKSLKILKFVVMKK